MVYVTFKAVLVTSDCFHTTETSGLLTTTVKASVTVGDEVTLIIRLQDIHDSMMNYPVGIIRQDVDDSHFRLKDDFALILRCVKSSVNDGLAYSFRIFHRVQFKTLNLFLLSFAIFCMKRSNVEVFFCYKRRPNI